MAKQTIITLVCDKCGKDETDERPVQRHRAKVDNGAIVNIDACTQCWKKVAEPFLALLELGEREPGSRRWRI